MSIDILQLESAPDRLDQEAAPAPGAYLVLLESSDPFPATLAPFLANDYQPKAIWRKPRSGENDYGTLIAFAVPIGETITVDKWWMPQARQQPAAPRQQTKGVAEPLPTTGEVVPPDKWWVEPARQRVVRRTARSDGDFAPVVQAGTSDFITLDQWFAPQVRQRPAAPRQVWVAEVFFLDGLPLPPFAVCCGPHGRPDEASGFRPAGDAAATFRGRGDESGCFRPPPDATTTPHGRPDEAGTFRPTVPECPDEVRGP